MRICSILAMLACMLAVGCDGNDSGSATESPTKGGVASLTASDTTFAFDLERGVALTPSFDYEPAAMFLLGLKYDLEEERRVLQTFGIGTLHPSKLMEFENSSFDDIDINDVEKGEWVQTLDVNPKSLYVIRSSDGNYGLVKFTEIDAELPGDFDQDWSLEFEWKYRSDGALP